MSNYRAMEDAELGGADLSNLIESYKGKLDTMRLRMDQPDTPNTVPVIPGDTPYAQELMRKQDELANQSVDTDINGIGHTGDTLRTGYDPSLEYNKPPRR